MQSSPNNSAEQDEALGQAVSRVFDLFSAGDTHIEYSASILVSQMNQRVRVFNPSDPLDSGDGSFDAVVVPVALSHAIMALREASYVVGSGTWFSITIVLTADGHVDVRYNYDQEPRWHPPVAATDYVADQERFPRAEEKQPDWLRAQLLEGRERIAANPGFVQTPLPVAGAYVPRRATGRLCWALGFLAFIPVPYAALLLAAIAMLLAYRSFRHSTVSVARENARFAANWALTIMSTYGVLAAVILLSAFAFPQLKDPHPTLVAIGAWVILAILHGIITISGTVTAGRDEVFHNALSIPFIRSRE